jgi:hypothetical protein
MHRLEIPGRGTWQLCAAGVPKHKLNRKARNRALKCNCGGYPFPHRRLSPACYAHLPAFQNPVTQDLGKYGGEPGPDVPF